MTHDFKTFDELAKSLGVTFDGMNVKIPGTVDLLSFQFLLLHYIDKQRQNLNFSHLLNAIRTQLVDCHSFSDVGARFEALAELFDAQFNPKEYSFIRIHNPERQE